MRVGSSFRAARGLEFGPVAGACSDSESQHPETMAEAVTVNHEAALLRYLPKYPLRAETRNPVRFVRTSTLWKRSFRRRRILRIETK